MFSPPTHTPSTQPQPHQASQKQQQSQLDSDTRSEPQAPTAPQDTAMPPSHELILILAATPSLGIGKSGGLPWPQLKKEMGYFARVTKRVTPSSKSPASGSGIHGGEGKRKINAVVMGRKTWDSIPPQFRPLKGRVNVVVTRDVAGFEKKLDIVKGNKKDGREGGVEGPVVASGILDALRQLQYPDPYHSILRDAEIHRIFIIGGASLYTTALELPATKRVLLTRIRKEFECDTFFSVDLEESEVWKKAERGEVAEFTGEGDDGEGEKGVLREGGVMEQGVGFEVEMFIRG